VEGGIKIKRIYDPISDSDGIRVLVDRLWPRGLTKREARVGLWARDLAPSDELRRWYRHDPESWAEFQERYFGELDRNPDAIQELLSAIPHSAVTFLFSSRETEFNNAVALKNYLEKRGLLD
jgi:uncharacterized protein YeaO (DUF488 family)